MFPDSIESTLVDELAAGLFADDSSVHELLLGLVTSPSFRFRHVEEN
jgi:hypothetical protein